MYSYRATRLAKPLELEDIWPRGLFRQLSANQLTWCTSFPTLISELTDRFPDSSDRNVAGPHHTSPHTLILNS